MRPEVIHDEPCSGPGTASRPEEAYPYGSGPGPAGHGGGQTGSPKILKIRASLLTMATTGFGYGSRLDYLDRAIYTTITVMSVLIVYDGWQNLKLGAAVGGNPRPGARHVRFTRLLSISRPASRAEQAPRPQRADAHHLDRVAFPSPGGTCTCASDHLDWGRDLVGQLAKCGCLTSGLTV